MKISRLLYSELSQFRCNLQLRMTQTRKLDIKIMITFAFLIEPTSEELCKQAELGFTKNKCGSILCNSKASNSIGGCDEFYDMLKSDCNFVFDCPKSGKTYLLQYYTV